MSALVDLLDKKRVHLDTKVLGISVLLIKNFDALADSLVVVDMSQARNVLLDVELLLKFQVHHLRKVVKPHVDVSARLLDRFKYTVYSAKIVGIDSRAQVTFSASNRIEAVIATADGALGVLSAPALEDPSSGRAKLAVELVTVFAIVLHVFEIELRLVALLAEAVSGLLTFLDKITRLRVRGEVEGRMRTGILEVQIDTKLHKALEDLDLRVGSSLMNTVVTMDVLKERVHALLLEDPDNLVVAVVRGPVHGRRTTRLGGVGDRLEVVLLLFFIIIGVLGLLLLLVLQVSLVLDKDSDDILVSVTGCPQKRVPAVFLNARVSADFERFSYIFIVVFLNRSHE